MKLPRRQHPFSHLQYPFHTSELLLHRFANKMFIMTSVSFSKKFKMSFIRADGTKNASTLGLLRASATPRRHDPDISRIHAPPTLLPRTSEPVCLYIQMTPHRRASSPVCLCAFTPSNLCVSASPEICHSLPPCCCDFIAWSFRGSTLWCLRASPTPHPPSFSFPHIHTLPPSRHLLSRP